MGSQNSTSQAERDEAASPIEVLVVEDSAVVREFLIHVLSSDPGIRIVGIARDGEEALDAVRRHRPDVVTMDIHMPKMDGLEATRRIMETDPTPIVIVSGSRDTDELALTFEAIEAGALALQSRPAGIGHALHEATARALVQTVKLMSEVKVVRRWPRVRPDARTARPAETGLRAPATMRVVAIGASTGGPPVLQSILAGLPKTFPVPLLIVQHMAVGFIHGFAGWLAHSIDLPIRVAADGDRLLPGHVYLAPDDHQMKVDRQGRVALTKDAPENGLRPSVSCLFRSVADVYGGGAVAGLLTGMGRDGAEELRVLREKGAITFAQDKESSVVHGMPGEAIRLDAAMQVLSPGRIVGLLTDLANRQGKNTDGA